jgi:hypothetical protein
MRRGMWIWILLLVLVGVGVGVLAYNAGLHEGLAESGRIDDDVRGFGPGFGFPFGLIFFLLFLFGIFALFRAAMWRGGPGWGHGPSGPYGPYGKGGHIEEWHRRLHEEEDRRQGSTGEPERA